MSFSLRGHGANENGAPGKEIGELRLTPTRLDGRAPEFPAATHVNTRSGLGLARRYRHRARFFRVIDAA
jgi:hypothetical protein